MEMAESEALFSFVGILAYAIVIGVGIKVQTRDKGKAYVFYIISWLCVAAYITLETICLFFESVLMWKAAYMSMSLALLFWLLFIDHAMGDGVNWKGFGVGVGFVCIYATWLLNPETTVSFSSFTNEFGESAFSATSSNELLYTALYLTYSLLYAISFTYWSLKTLKAAPEMMRKPAKMLKYAALILVAGVISNILYSTAIIEGVLDGIIHDLLPIVSFIGLLGNAIILSFATFKAPKIAHLLPYRVYSLIVMSKDGVPWIEHKWVNHDIETTLLSGLLSAINTMTKGIMDSIKTGSIREVVLENARFLLYPNYSTTTIGLVTSKSSLELRNSLEGFAKEFVETFYSSLYTEDGDARVVCDPSCSFPTDTVNAIINKHFNTVPSWV